MINIQTITTGLELAENGIWYSGNTEDISYPSDGNEACVSIEENSFWFKHRNNCIISIVNAYPPEQGEAIFDIGGGNGFVSWGLANAGYDMVVLEPGPTGCLNTKKRGINNVICATIDTANFKSYSIPAVGLFDVIEHIEDDLAFLKTIKSLLKKGGYLYATVPSYSWLWSEEDDLAGHFRRYTLDSISNTLKSAGFEIEFSSHIFRFLPFPIFFLRTLPYKLGLKSKGSKNNNITRDHAVKNNKTRSILNAVLQPEIENIKRNKPMMFGGSCLIVAKSC